MAPRSYRRLFFLVLTLCGVGLVGGCATPTSPHLTARTQSDPGHAPSSVTHEPTGLEFPASLASATRVGETVTSSQKTAYYTDRAGDVTATLAFMANDASEDSLKQAIGRMINELLRNERLIVIAYGQSEQREPAHPPGYWARLIPGELVDGVPSTPSSGGMARHLVVEPVPTEPYNTHIAVAYLRYPYPNDKDLSKHAEAILAAWRNVYAGNGD